MCLQRQRRQKRDIDDVLCADSQPTRTRMAPRTQYLQTDAGRVAYQVVGDGPIDIVQIPGFVSNVDLQWADPAFARFQNRLASFGRLIVYDPLGVGASDPLPHGRSIEEKVCELEELIDATGAQRPLLFGISVGCATGFTFAARHPDRTLGLVAIAPTVKGH